MSLKNGLELRFHPREKQFPSWFNEDAQGPDHPCFLATGAYTTESKEEYHCEAYQFYFTDNDAIGLCGLIPKAGWLGYHAHDCEGVFVLFSRSTGEPHSVYFKAHGLGQGHWLPWDKCDKNENGALVVYFALGSHATYGRNRTAWRIFCFAPDFVSSRGKRILINEKNYILPSGTDRLGKGIRVYDTIQKISNYSISVFERLLFPLTDRAIRARALKN